MGEPEVDLQPLNLDLFFDANKKILNISSASSSSSGYSSMDINLPHTIPFNEDNLMTPNFFDWTDVKLLLRSILPLSSAVLGDMKSRLFITLPSPELEGCPIINYFYTFCIDILPQVSIDMLSPILAPMDIEDVISRLDIEIMGPLSTELPFDLQIFKSEGSQWRIFCSFRPYICGVHNISVRIFGIGQNHIAGSPFVKSFSRNYAQSRNTRPIVNINVQDTARIHDRPKYHPNPNWFNECENEYEDEMKKPWGICSNTKTDEIIVCDRADHEILVYSPDGSLLFRFGEYGTEPGQFNRPTGIAYDTTYDRLLITDKDNNRVQIFTPTGQFQTTFGRRGLLSGQFMFPWGIAVTRDGQHIAISDSRNSRVQLFNSSFQYLRKFSIRCDNPILYKEVFNYPRGIAFSLNGDFLYVTDFNLHQVIRLDISLKEYQQLQTTIPMVRPQGITVDDAGNILVCSSRQHSIKIFNPNGQFLFEIKSLADSPFDLPIDITPLKAGFMAILDLNGRIRVF